MLGTRRYLAFFRSGEKSLHGRILSEDPNRNWDCCVNWYVPRPVDDRAEMCFTGGDNKFEGFELFLSQTGLGEHYEHIFVLDDDLLFRPGDVSRYFDLCQANRLYLSQPGLAWRSYFSYSASLRNPACVLRRVNFIEVMAPCFSRAALRDLRKTFLYTKSTYGIDWAWSAEAAQHERLYVVDAVPILHTKPIDQARGAFYRKLRSWGVDPNEEARRVLSAYPGLVRRAVTLESGHVFAGWLPRWAETAAMLQWERAKRMARLWMALRLKARGIK
jgi:hypothetical protein